RLAAARFEAALCHPAPAAPRSTKYRSAQSGDFLCSGRYRWDEGGRFGHGRRFLGAHEMGFMGTAIDRTYTVRQFRSGEQAVRLRDLALAMHPLGFNRVEPRTLAGQEAGDQAHALAGLLDLPIVLAQPGAHDLAIMPGGIVPDQQDRALA